MAGGRDDARQVEVVAERDRLDLEVDPVAALEMPAVEVEDVGRKRDPVERRMPALEVGIRGVGAVVAAESPPHVAAGVPRRIESDAAATAAINADGVAGTVHAVTASAGR